MAHPSLEVLQCLETIVKALASEKTLSATKLKRTYEFNNEIFDAAVLHGHEKNILKWGERNIFSYIVPYVIPEEAYYPHIAKSLCNLWEEDNYDKSQFYIETTARRNSKIAGPWTRPDFTIVSHKKFPWTIGYEFDVVTFEAKRIDSLNVLAVFEALSHMSAATRSYIVFPIDEVAWIERDKEQAQRVKDECVRHGVGLILIGNVGSNPLPVHAIRARRRDIDHRKCSDFLAAVLSEDGKNKIAEWK